MHISTNHSAFNHSKCSGNNMYSLERFHTEAHTDTHFTHILQLIEQGLFTQNDLQKNTDPIQASNLNKEISVSASETYRRTQPHIHLFPVVFQWQSINRYVKLIIFPLQHIP